jgi:hypothetical protein
MHAAVTLAMLSSAYQRKYNLQQAVCVAIVVDYNGKAFHSTTASDSQFRS